MSASSLPALIRQLFRRLLAPGCCLACGHELADANTLCPGCQQRLESIPNPCQYCAEPNPDDALICPRCRLNPPRWQRMRIPFHYRGLVREYLIQIKFAEALHLAYSLTQYSNHAIGDLETPPEALLPVPLHPSRLLGRGYNQANEIAKLWSQSTGIPVDHDALYRIRATTSQSGLNASRRIANVHAAFDYRPKRRYRHVAIVDDIVTTGSTIDEITRLLHRQGVEFVEVWALARAYR